VRESEEKRETSSAVALTEVGAEVAIDDFVVGLRVRTLSKLAERSLTEDAWTEGASVFLTRD